MRINIFAFCDFAADYGEKVCIIGASHKIPVRDLPAKVSGTLVGKIMLERDDAGEHLLDITISDADGKVVCQCPRQQIEARDFIDLPQECEMYSCCIIQRVQFQVEKYGEYVLGMREKGRVLASTALFVGRFDSKPEIY